MLIDEKKRRALEALQFRLAVSRFDFFVQCVNHDYLMGWVHQAICEKLDRFFDQVKAKESPRLIICLPPRSGKSQIASRSFPAYVFGRDPDMQVIACSYSADLSASFNRDVQRIMASDVYHRIFPATALNVKNTRSISDFYVRTSEKFEIVGHRGSYRSAGVGGGISGMGADILIIDDPIKDRAEADSQTIRQKVFDWYTSTAYTRLSPGGGVIVMATRWHEDDLIGRLVERSDAGSGDAFEVINFPALAEVDEPHRKKGEALHPERFSRERLLSIKRTIGSRDWSALYQQHPTPDGGAIIKREWLNFYVKAQLPPRFDELIQSWDMSFKDSVASDFVVGQVWGRVGANYFLLHQVRGQYDFVASKARLIELTNAYPKATRKLVEDKANGPAIIADLRGAVHGIVPVNPKESKIARANAVAPLFEAGNVFLPKDAPWIDDYTGELLSFPSASHDDQVDATTQALNYFRQSRNLTLSPEVVNALRTPFRR